MMLLQFNPSRPFKVLFAARHVNENQETAPPSSGQYPRYHQEIRAQLESLGLDVDVTSTTESLDKMIGRVDYVFSLMNRVPINNGEVFVSALCEYAGVPYLGASPAIRALAEDKHIAKHFAASLGVSTARWIVSAHELPLPIEAPFNGPYFIKPRTGAASEHISSASRQTEWSGACSQAEVLTRQGVEAMVERFCPGENVTVPIIGADRPKVLPPVLLESGMPHGILTYDNKLQTAGDMPFRLLDPSPQRDAIVNAALSLYRDLQPVDYARFDFRLDPKTGDFQFLEVNICCDISSFGSLMFAANAAGYSQAEVISHVLAYSYSRQQRSGKNGEGIEGPVFEKSRAVGLH